MHEMMGYHWPGMALWIFFLVLIVAGIVLVISSFMGRKARGDKTAMEIIKERYARGEISREEFEEKKRDISG